MVNLIVGNKGSGKTKALIGAINQAFEKTKGNVVCIDKSLKLRFELNHSVRIVDVEEFNISSYSELYGLIAGLVSANYDIEEIFIDSILKIGGKNLSDLGEFLAKADATFKNVSLTITVSADKEELPDTVVSYM